MIDLDDQLTAYSEYLDDTERRVVVLRPARLDGTPAGGRRTVALIAAGVIAIAGVTAVAVVARDRGPAGVATTDDTEWTVVPDPNGVFTPTEDGSQAGSETSGSSSDSAIRVTSVESLDDGFVAVGLERQGMAQIGAIWTSANGDSWERIPHDASFGVEGFSDDPSDVGPTMWDVAERNSRVVVAGSERPTSEAMVWISDDLESWHVVDLGTSGPGRPTSIAAGTRGFAMVGIDEGDADTADNAVGWFSTNGESWEVATFENAWGARVSDVIALGDGFLASGSSGSMAAVWTSDDGLDWQLADVEQTPRIGLNFTSIDSVVEFDGVLYGYGRAGTSSDPVLDVGQFADTVQPALWTSADGLVWTSSSPVEYEANTVRFPGQFVSTAVGLIGFGVEFTSDGGIHQFELRSEDGVRWTERDLDLPGTRYAAAFRDGTAVALGEAEDRGFATVESGDPDESAGAFTAWILHTG